MELRGKMKMALIFFDKKISTIVHDLKMAKKKNLPNKFWNQDGEFLVFLNNKLSSNTRGENISSENARLQNSGAS